MDKAEQAAKTVKETLEGIGEGTMHGLKIATGMGHTSVKHPAGPLTPGVNYPSELATAAFPTTMEPAPTRPLAVPTSKPTLVTEPMAIPKPSLVESIKENVQAAGERVMSMAGYGADKATATGQTLKEMSKDHEAAAADKAKEARISAQKAAAHGLQSVGDQAKEKGRDLEYKTMH